MPRVAVAGRYGLMTCQIRISEMHAYMSLYGYKLLCIDGDQRTKKAKGQLLCAHSPRPGIWQGREWARRRARRRGRGERRRRVPKLWPAPVPALPALPALPPHVILPLVPPLLPLPVLARALVPVVATRVEMLMMVMPMAMAAMVPFAECSPPGQGGHCQLSRVPPLLPRAAAPFPVQLSLPAQIRSSSARSALGSARLRRRTHELLSLPI